MKKTELKRNKRILIIDDNPSIHNDFRDILCPAGASSAAASKMEAALFDDAPAAEEPESFELDSAYQGEQGWLMVQQALKDNRPYAMAFVDVRMPPGWDGVETVARIWEVCPELQVVVCTAYTDYSWDEMRARVGQPDSMLVLKKPFDNIEVQQMAHALPEKWRLHQAMKLEMDQLEELVQERTQVLQATNFTLEKTNKDLKEAMAKVKTLEGLLPICAHCKKIRDDKGQWNQIELFIRDRSAATFSHGICPTCIEQLYPQFDLKSSKESFGLE
jgi:DNA-binding LytR/AlgR family response regulator